MFDSGVGGLYLFSQLDRLLPNETIYYLADSAHFPYGEKSQNEIIQHSLQCVSFLLEKQIKLLVVACFTASAIAIESILSFIDIPVVNVVDNLIEELMGQKQVTRVALLGTKATIESGILQKKVSERCDWPLFPIIGSELVQSIEKRDEKVSRALLVKYLDYFTVHNIDTVLLACTHFAHILPLMREVWGEGITIVEGASCAAAKIASSVELAGQKRSHRLFATGDPALFQAQSERFIKIEVEPAEPNLATFKA